MSNIRLRLMTPADATEEYASWLGDPEVNRWLSVKTATPDTQREYIEAWAKRKDARLFAICCHDRAHPPFPLQTCEGRVIGSLKLELLLGYPNASPDVVVLALMIGDKTHWGRGIATLAIRAGTELAFQMWPTIVEVQAGIHPRNIGSVRAFEKSDYQIDWPARVWAMYKRR